MLGLKSDGSFSKASEPGAHGQGPQIRITPAGLATLPHPSLLTFALSAKIGV